MRLLAIVALAWIGILHPGPAAPRAQHAEHDSSALVEPTPEEGAALSHEADAPLVAPSAVVHRRFLERWSVAHTGRAPRLSEASGPESPRRIWRAGMHRTFDSDH